MRSIHCLFVAAFILVSCYSKGQDTLRINPAALDSLHSTTFVLDDSSTSFVTMSMWLYNTSSVNTFSDSITFGYIISQGGVSTPYLASATPASGVSFSPMSVTIQPRDSVLVTGIQFQFSSPDFVVGTSTVVIWPAVYSGNPFVLLDSASQQLTITPPTGIINTERDDLKAYMSGEDLIVKSSSANLVGDIRIYDMAGKLVISQQIAQQALIPMQPYASGVYLVEIISNDGERAVFKVLNSPAY